VLFSSTTIKQTLSQVLALQRSSLEDAFETTCLSSHKSFSQELNGDLKLINVKKLMLKGIY
jgi:hypothetical protein